MIHIDASFLNNGVRESITHDKENIKLSHPFVFGIFCHLP